MSHVQHKEDCMALWSYDNNDTSRTTPSKIYRHWGVSTSKTAKLYLLGQLTTITTTPPPPNPNKHILSYQPKTRNIQHWTKNKQSKIWHDNTLLWNKEEYMILVKVIGPPYFHLTFFLPLPPIQTFPILVNWPSWYCIFAAPKLIPKNKSIQEVVLIFESKNVLQMVGHIYMY